MADLSKLKTLLLEANTEAETLEKNIAVLKSECEELSGNKLSLDATITYLRSSIETAKKEATEIQSSNEKALELEKTARSKALQELKIIKADIEVNRNILNQLFNQIEASKLEYDDLSTKNASKIAELNTEILSLEKTKTDTQNAYDILASKMETLHDRILKSTDELSTIQKSIKTESELAIKLANIIADTEIAQQQLNDTRTQHDKMQSEVDIFNTSRQEFIEYEQRSIKALESREQSIMDRELQFKLEVATNKHRNRILEKTP